MNAKLLIPLVGLGVAGLATLGSKKASAATGSGTGGGGTAPAASGSGKTPSSGGAPSGPPLTVVQRMVDALATNDPKKIRALATQLDAEGFQAQAADLRAAAAAIEAGQTANVPPPTSVPTTPQSVGLPQLPPAANLPSAPTAPLPVVVPTSVSIPVSAPIGLTVTVLKGEGPAAIAKRVLGANGANRWPELVAANVPPKKKDPKTGNFTSLNPGEVLKLPASWVPTAQTSAPATIPTIATTTATVPLRRLVIVQKGEGPYQITARVLGAASANRWPELVAANVPPKKKGKDGNFTALNVGEKLVVPSNWPNSNAFVMGADPVHQRTLRAGKIALGLHFGRLDPDLLAEWQRREGLPATGKYGPDSAMVLCYRYGFVPPKPALTPAQVKPFIEMVMRRAKKDPQRVDEYRKLARDAASGR